MQRAPLTDGHGRRIGDLRVSVTDRCNFRCQYCMPAEGLPWLEREEILRFEEIERLVALFAQMGVARRAPDRRRAARAPRLPATGRDARGVAGRRPVADHQRLPARARRRRARRRRLDRFNVSIDSLQRDRFFEITRRDALPQVLAGLEALAALPRGAPDQGQRGRPARLHRGRGRCPSRASRASTPTRSASSSSCRSTPTAPGRPTGAHRRRGARRDRAPCTRSSRAARAHATARVYRFADGRGRIGFINPVSEPFCGDCDRIRLTADGRLRTCLFSLNETDLRGPLRAGAGDDELAAIIRDAVWRKELKHHVNDPGFIQPARTMSAIGG